MRKYEIASFAGLGLGRWLIQTNAVLQPGGTRSGTLILNLRKQCVAKRRSYSGCPRGQTTRKSVLFMPLRAAGRNAPEGRTKLTTYFR